MINSADILNAKILVVDDEEADILLLVRTLHIAGYTAVESTTDPKEVCDLHRYEQMVAVKKSSAAFSLYPGAMVGSQNEERLATHWFRSLRLRNQWVQVNLFTAFIAAAVVGLFQGTLDRLLILTFFLPVLADQSGNTGSQALAITLRGITLGDLHSGKELALVAASGMYAVATLQHLPSASMLSAVVFLAMIGSCFISGIRGA
ncbi:MAG: magnesium transporter [Desulfobulbaceae bacterium]|nr:magnesium transporter [Desulfobulbaceae bacterium]